MNKVFLIIFTAVMAVTAAAQDYGKMSPALRNLTRSHTALLKAKGSVKSSMGRGRHAVFLAQGEDEALKEYSLLQSNDIHVVRVPIDKLAELSEDRRVKRMEASFCKHSTTLDTISIIISADKAHTGTTPLPQAFDGTGVVVGIGDTGFDYSHPAYRSLKDGRLRIVQAYDCLDASESHGTLGTLLPDTSAIIRAIHSKDAFIIEHGTHTSTTAAGSGWGTANIGIAPEADIYLATLVFSNNSYLIEEEETDTIDADALVAMVFNKIFTYADSVGKPCVINYSAGRYESATDFDQLAEAMLKSLTGAGRIIVSTTGNNGEQKCYLPKRAADNIVGGRLRGNPGYDIMSLTMRTQGKMVFRIFDIDNPDISREIQLDFQPGNTAETSPSGLAWRDFTSFPDDGTMDSIMIEVYSSPNGLDPSYIGYDITISGEYDRINGRNLGIAFIGEGTEAEIITQLCTLEPLDYGGTMLSGTQKGGTLLFPGTLPGIICVGATSHRTGVVTADGKWFAGSSIGDGTIASFSSIGPSASDIMKPDVVAPGVMVKAAYNRFNTNNLEYLEKQITDNISFGGETFSYLAHNGTSMSAPVVSGTIALWLQADPTLTTERIMEVIAKTSTHPDPTLSYPNYTYGYGEINAYAGLLEILGLTNVKGLSSQQLSDVVVRPHGDGISVMLSSPSTSPLPCRIYSASGTLMKAVTLEPGRTEHHIPVNAAGIIAIQVGNMGSTLVRL